jgi:hypothetical protein
MVVTSRQFWIAAAFGLCGACASAVPDGEVACRGEGAAARCPSSVPVCEQRAGDAAAFCYRTRQARTAIAARFGEQARSPQHVRVPASRNFRLIGQSVASADGALLAAGR